jgi:peptidoglycan-associated lipoprotein
MKTIGKLAPCFGLVLFLALTAACHKKIPVAAAPAPPPVEAPQPAQLAPPPPAIAAAPAKPAPIVAEPEAPPPAPAPTIAERLAQEVRDAYFDFDKSDIRPDARDALTANAAALKLIMRDFPNTTVVMEGYCDERGSAEYNIALGDRRATTAKIFLRDLGVPAERLLTISYGKERPQCTESNEACWQKNRRVHFVAGEEQKPPLLSGADAGN